jgi:hypothetical protein
MSSCQRPTIFLALGASSEVSIGWAGKCERCLNRRKGEKLSRRFVDIKHVETFLSTKANIRILVTLSACNPPEHATSGAALANADFRSV